jgi:hypothetical protein
MASTAFLGPQWFLKTHSLRLAAPSPNAPSPPACGSEPRSLQRISPWPVGVLSDLLTRTSWKQDRRERNRTKPDNVVVLIAPALPSPTAPSSACTDAAPRGRQGRRVTAPGIPSRYRRAASDGRRGDAPTHRGRVSPRHLGSPSVNASRPLLPAANHQPMPLRSSPRACTPPGAARQLGIHPDHLVSIG